MGPPWPSPRSIPAFPRAALAAVAAMIARRTVLALVLATSVAAEAPAGLRGSVAHAAEATNAGEAERGSGVEARELATAAAGGSLAAVNATGSVAVEASQSAPAPSLAAVNATGGADVGLSASAQTWGSR